MMGGVWGGGRHHLREIQRFKNRGRKPRDGIPTSGLGKGPKTGRGWEIKLSCPNVTSTRSQKGFANRDVGEGNLRRPQAHLPQKQRVKCQNVGDSDSTTVKEDG